MLFLCCAFSLEAGQIIGKIQLKEEGQLRSEKGEAFVGEINLEDQKKFLNFPDYLTAMIDSLENQRRSEINEKGEFVVSDVPINKKVIIGISFSGVKYFFERKIDGSGVLKLEEVINLDNKSKPCSVFVKNKTGRVFKSDFSAVSYLIGDGLSGRVFAGKKTGDDKIDFGVVPLGSYKIYVLNEVKEDAPNRVDVMPVDVMKDNEDEVIFEVK